MRGGLVDGLRAARALRGLELPAACDDVVEIADRVLADPNASADAKLLATAITQKARAKCDVCATGTMGRRALCADVVLRKGTEILHCSGCGQNRLPKEVSRQLRNSYPQCPSCGRQRGDAQLCVDGYHRSSGALA